jgi:hypothetical protein
MLNKLLGKKQEWKDVVDTTANGFCQEIVKGFNITLADMKRRLPGAKTEHLTVMLNVMYDALIAATVTLGNQIAGPTKEIEEATVNGVRTKFAQLREEELRASAEKGAPDVNN